MMERGKALARGLCVQRASQTKDVAVEREKRWCPQLGPGLARLQKLVIKAAAVRAVLGYKYLLLMASLSRGGKAGYALPQTANYHLTGVWSSPVGSREEGSAVAPLPRGARVAWFHSALRTSSPEKWYC